MLVTNRRDLSLFAGALFAGLSRVEAKAAGDTTAPDGSEISHTNDAIHQEVGFSASPERVYETLTTASQFDKVVQLSAAMKSGALAHSPTQISTDEGGAFVLFGGYITGRHIELVPHARIVQAWRSASWPAGIYSIARFELLPMGKGTKLVFDHTGFPAGTAPHLAAGWHGNYWEPLAKVLA